MFGAGMHIRRNSSLSVFNSVFAGWNTGLLLDATTTYANTTSGSLAIQNTALVANKVKAINGASSVTEAQASEFFNTSVNANKIMLANFNKVAPIEADSAALISTSFYDATKTGTDANPTSFLPASGSMLLGTGAFAHTKLQNAFFDKTATYMGAFGATDWTKETWVNFDPQNTVY